MVNPASATFEHAIEEATALFGSIDSGMSEENARKVIAALLQAVPTARGFFVALLTNEFKVSDQPPAFLLEELQVASAVTFPLIAKNLVMSSASKLIHERNKDEQNARGSEQVIRRTSGIISSLNDSILNQHLEDMRKALAGEQTSFSDFVNRMNYDLEQRNAASAAIGQLI
jgi:hypothetical protein